MGARTQSVRSNWRVGKLMLSSFLVLLVCSMLASAAYAGTGTSADDQYETTGAIVPATAVTKAAVATTASTPPAVVATSSGDLPFTGLSLVSIVLLGGALVIVGFILRRRNTREEI